MEEEEVSGTTAELQRLLAKNNAELLRAFDIQSSGVAGMLKETNEKIALQNELIAGLVHSVRELIACVGAQQEHKPQMIDTPTLEALGGPLQGERKQIDFSPVIEAIREHMPKIDAVPMKEDIRADLLALLEGVRESNELTVERTVKTFREEVQKMRLPEVFNTFDARRRQDNDEAFLAMLQALRESKAEVEVGDSAHRSLMKMQAAAKSESPDTAALAGKQALSNVMNKNGSERIR